VYWRYGWGGGFVLRTIDYAVQNLASRSGISVFLVRGIVILASIPFFWAIYKFTHGFLLLGVRPSLRLYGSRYGLIIVAYVGVFFIAMYFASRDALFYKFCAQTPEGIETFDSAVVDPIYGIASKPCTVEQIEALRHSGPQRVHITDPKEFDFFDPITGQPRVWFYKLPNGTYVFYNHPGKYPGTGDSLRPIDRVTAEELILRPTLIAARSSSLPEPTSETTAQGATAPTEVSGTQRSVLYPEGLSVTVPGLSMWTDTSLNLRAGQSFTVTATGDIQFSYASHGGPAAEGADCASQERPSLSWVAPGLRCHSLLGRIGDKGRMFEIGSGGHFVADASGRLYLGVNDNYFPDNSGSWTARISIDHP